MRRGVWILVLAVSVGVCSSALAADEKPPSTSSSSQTTQNATVDEDILTAYAGAIRYFNPKATEAQARAVARPVIVYGHACGLDARLLVAVLAEEGRLDQIREDADGVLLAGRSPSVAVRNLAEDLSERVEWERYGNEVTEKILAAALRERAKDVLERKPGKYADNVLRLYRKLTRTDQAAPKDASKK